MTAPLRGPPRLHPRPPTLFIGVLGQPARLLRDGRVAHGVITWDADRGDLPSDVDIELLVQSGGTVLGRFLMQPVPGAPVTSSDREQAVAVADQLGAALR